MIDKIRLLKTRSSEEGFTLIELMIVIVVIGILAAIAIPIFANQQKAAQTAAVKTDIKNIALAMENFYTKNRIYPMSSVELASSPIVVSDKSYYSTNTNLLLCISNSNNFGYAIYAKTSSGEVLSYSSYSGKLKTETITFPESMTVICPTVGITPGQPNQIGIWGYANAAWEPWVK